MHLGVKFSKSSLWNLCLWDAQAELAGVASPLEITGHQVSDCCNPEAPSREMPQTQSPSSFPSLLERWRGSTARLILFSPRPFPLIIQPHPPVHLLVCCSVDSSLVHLCFVPFLFRMWMQESAKTQLVVGLTQSHLSSLAPANYRCCGKRRGAHGDCGHCY